MCFRSGYGIDSVCGHVSIHKDTNPSRILPALQAPVICNLTGESYSKSRQEPSIHRASFTHFTLVLTLLRACQEENDSPTKRGVETSVVRSASTHKHKSKSVTCARHILLKTNCVYEHRMCFRSGFGVVAVCGHVSRYTDTEP